MFLAELMRADGTQLGRSAEQKRVESEEQLDLLQTIAREVAAASDLSAALEIVLRCVCEKTGWTIGQAWVPNKERSALDRDSFWFDAESECQEFRAASEASHFKHGEGLPGRVWQSKRPAWVEDVTDDPNFPRSDAARTSGLKTGVGIPILSGNQVIAVLEFFMRESRDQNERLLNVIASVAGQLDLLRRATNAEATARERQFRTLANSISQLAWMADSEGYIFWYNDRWYDYTGTTLEEMQGWRWQKVHHPDEVGRVVERIKVAFATGEPWEDTFPLRSKNGEYRWFLSRALPVFDAEGKVARWFGTNTDITEQRQIEQALREKERQFRTLANSIPQLAWMADRHGYIFWYNDRWYNYTGTTLEEMQGWGWQKVHHPDEVERVVERIKIAFATGEPWEDTFPLRSKDGEYRWFLSRALPITDAEGKVVRWFGTNTDITEQRELERALRASRDELEQKVTDRTAELSRTNEILRSILSNMGDAVIVADKDKNFLVFNPAAERMFGKGAMQVPSTEWSHRYGLYLPDKVTPFPHDQLPMTRSIRGEEVNNEEMFVRHEKAPHGMWTRITGRPLRDSNGELLGGVIVCRDITRAKEEEFFRAGQSQVLEMIAADAPLADVLTRLVLLMEQQAEGLRCSVLLLSRDGKHVMHGAAPNLPEPYVKAVDGAPIGPHAGSCGTAMYTRKPVVVTDVMTDPVWADYRDLAQICGLSSCWSTPILSPQGDVLGSFAMYRPEKRGPQPEETRLTAVATHIAGIAIERQRQQGILREREARISLAAESADIAFWVLYPDQTSAWMSEKGRKMYGFDSTVPVTCEMILSRVHPEERAAVKANYDSGCASHGTFESEHRLLLPYGKTRWVIMRGRCLEDEKGKLLETIGITIDVSVQKQADLQQQLQREEMAHRNRVSLMGEMTASFAHELNQPLTAIANNAWAARRFLERGKIDPELLQQLLRDMVADSQRAGEVIRGIRSLVRKDTAVQHALLNLNAIIADTVRLVSSDVLSRESVLTTELDPQLPQVNAAPVQIQQVLLNLIMNALDAVDQLPPAERRIVISTRSDKGDVAEIRVRDFGIGLPKDRPEKVFDHFFSTKQKGMGMGLTIVRSIVEAHGGTINAENAPDRGTCMTVRLPAVRPEVQKNKAAA
jgi:PAS domain S-box-containing protein